MPTKDEQPQAPASTDSVGRLVLRAYRQMLDYLFLSTSSIVGLLIVLIFFPGVVSLLFHQNSPPISIFLLVVMAGTLGAFFSALLRFYELKNLPTALYEDGISLSGLSLFIYTLTPALIGGIAAAILYLIFQANLLQGAPFPTFDCVAPDKKCPGLGALLENYGPQAPADFAKAILWGFIAGFAERLVPDLLENFAQADAVKNGSKATQLSDDGKAKADNKAGSSEPDENGSPPSGAPRINPQMASRGAANTG
jgi:hypothetical protein